VFTNSTAATFNVFPQTENNYSLDLTGNVCILPKVLELSVEWMTQLGKTVKNKEKTITTTKIKYNK
jgi:hypothetical protein